MDYKGKRLITHGCRAMTHYGGMEMSMQSEQRPNYKDEGRANFDFLKTLNEDTEAWAKKFMTKPEYQKFIKNDDVYFPFARVKQIFKGVEVI